VIIRIFIFFFFSSRRRHTRFDCDWSSDVCSSDLVNGKRRHSSALVHVNGTFGRGTVGVDLNAIPAAAIERIEVLRDGAAAQYGSDAIAGGINVVLKEQAQRLDVTSTGGATPWGD